MQEAWTPEQIAAMRAEGRPLRLAFARQTPEQKAEQRRRMVRSLQQTEGILSLWRELARAVRELRVAVEKMLEGVGRDEPNRTVLPERVALSGSQETLPTETTGTPAPQ